MTERTVVIHADVDGSPRVAGRLTAIAANEREEAHLELDPLWQNTSRHRLLQPMLRCLRGPHLAGGTMPLFGAIGDSAPDRWGRTLMRRAERKRAWREKRPPRVLSESDFLLGVNDGSRPKATVRDRDGHMLNAKFPSRGDPRDMQRREALAHECGICVPAFGIVRVKGCSVMLARRFDREEGSGRRLPFVSMLGPFGADDKKSQSYARMAELVREIGSRPRERAISLDVVDDRAALREEIHAMRGAFEHEELEQALHG